MRVALDAMGGDYAPAATVEGAVEAVREYHDLHEVILFGDEPSILKELSGKKYPKGSISIRHTTEVVAMDEPISQAFKRKKDSSIRKAVEAAKQGDADAVVSMGNSGVAMSTALLLMGKSRGVLRPAIATTMPTLKKPFVLIDAGANVDCEPENMLQFAIMAEAYCRLVLDRPNPKVALLSIGEEAKKGNELTRQAFKLIEKAGLNFTGNIEGKDIFLGEADVVVCDGFVGNVVLKTSEGLAEVTIKMLKREIASMATGRLGYLLLKPALRNFKKQTDYAEYGGAPLLGINGVCIIGHGRSSSKAIKNAIRMAKESSRQKVYDAITQGIEALKPLDRKVAH